MIKIKSRIKKKRSAPPMIDRTIVLASASPRRRDLLREHGCTVRIKPADIEELMPRHLTVGETTLLNAQRKARAVARTERAAMVLAADTLVAIGGRILGKPRDLDEAFEMLSLLSGNTHEVFSGVWLICTAAKKNCGFIEVSRVTFRKLTPAEIREYMRRIGPLDKAGAYAAQQNEMEVIASIQGSRTNVVGLPMEKLAAALRIFES
jgi:septum formation protein